VPSLLPMLLGLNQATELKEFWAATRRVLQAAVPHQSIIFFVGYFDFPRYRKASAVLQYPQTKRVESYWERRWATSLTRHLVPSKPRDAVFHTLEGVPDQKTLFESDFYRYIFAPEHLVEGASLGFDDNGTVHSGFEIYKNEEQGFVTPQDIQILSDLRPWIGGALRRVLIFEQAKALSLISPQIQAQAPVVMILSWNLEILFAPEEALNHCASWNFGIEKARYLKPRQSYRLPAVFRATCEDLREQWLNSGCPDSTPKADLKAENGRLLAHIAMQNIGNRRLQQIGFVIRLERASGPSTDVLSRDTLLARLTPSEREVARLIVEGLTNSEIGLRLNRSAYTVRNQLASIFAKSRVMSRARLAALLTAR
jgi:DNA-binding CsgD family transcriptional regulator